MCVVAALVACRSTSCLTVSSYYCLFYGFLISFSSTSPPPLTVQQYRCDLSSSLYGLTHISICVSLDWFGMSCSFASFYSTISAARRISPSPVRVFARLLGAV